MKKKQPTKYSEEMERRDQFVVAKIIELMPKVKFPIARLSQSSRVGHARLAKIIKGQVSANSQDIDRLSQSLAVSPDVFIADPEMKFETYAIDLIVSYGSIVTASKILGMSPVKLKKMVIQNPYFREAVRCKVQKYIALHPMNGPSSACRDLGLYPLWVRTHCKDMFATDKERIPKPMRIPSNGIRFEFESKNGCSLYQVLLLLVNGVAESDVSNQIGCSLQYVYHVRDEAIDAGFKFF